MVAPPPPPVINAQPVKREIQVISGNKIDRVIFEKDETPGK
jgi:hypothetical protein